MSGGVQVSPVFCRQLLWGEIKAVFVHTTPTAALIGYSNVLKDTVGGLVTNTETWNVTFDLWWPASFLLLRDPHTHLPQVGHYRSIGPRMFCVQPILSILIHHNRKWLIKPPERKRTEVKQCFCYAKSKTSYAALPPVVAFSVKEGFSIAVQVRRGIFPHHAFFLII